MLIFSHVSYHKFKCVGLDSMGYMRTRNTPEILGFPRLSADGRGCVEIRKWRRVRDSNPRYRCRHFAFRVRRFRPLSQLSSLRQTPLAAVRRSCKPLVAKLPPDSRERQRGGGRSEEHTSELQSLMRISYAVFCLKKKKKKKHNHTKCAIEIE